MIPARLEPCDSLAERRTARRHRLKLDVYGTSPGDGELEAVILDLSQTGMLIQTGAALEVGDYLTVEDSGFGAFDGVVAWNTDHYFGCEFVKPISGAVVSAALLKSDPLVGPPMLKDSATPASSIAELGRGDLSRSQRLLILIGLSLTGWAVLIGLVAIASAFLT